MHFHQSGKKTLQNISDIFKRSDYRFQETAEAGLATT